MIKFPAINRILNSKEFKNSKPSISFLLQHRGLLKRFDCVEDFVTRWVNDGSKISPKDENLLRGYEHHLINIRVQLLKEFTKRELYLGVTVLDELLFSHIRDTNQTEPIKEALTTLKKAGVLQPGLLIYPLHSFGVSYGGIIKFLTKKEFELIFKDANMIVSPQTNSFDKTVALIERSNNLFGIKKKIPVSLLKHWYRSRGLKWLNSNPLLIIKCQNYTDEYYGNQFYIRTKLRVLSTLILALSCLQETRPTREGTLFSTARVNNFETLDIQHFLNLFPEPRSKKLSGHCVPINVDSSILSELSETRIIANHTYWMRESRLKKNVIQQFLKLNNAYLEAHVSAKGCQTKKKIVRKLFKALTFFKRSFRDTGDDGDKVLFQAIAFETMLEDSFARGIGNRLEQKVKILLRGVRGTKNYQSAVSKLYKLRSEYTHSGFVEFEEEVLNVARRAFVLCFIKLMEKLAKERISSNGQAVTSLIGT